MHDWCVQLALSESAAQIPLKLDVNLSDWGEGVNGEDELGGWLSRWHRASLRPAAPVWVRSARGAPHGAQPRGSREKTARKRSRAEVRGGRMWFPWESLPLRAPQGYK